MQEEISCVQIKLNGLVGIEMTILPLEQVGKGQGITPQPEVEPDALWLLGAFESRPGYGGRSLASRKTLSNLS